MFHKTLVISNVFLYFLLFYLKIHLSIKKKTLKFHEISEIELQRKCHRIYSLMKQSD